jgi:hypothetical protein
VQRQGRKPPPAKPLQAKSVGIECETSGYYSFILSLFIELVYKIDRYSFFAQFVVELAEK